MHVKFLRVAWMQQKRDADFTSAPHLIVIQMSK